MRRRHVEGWKSDGSLILYCVATACQQGIMRDIYSISNFKKCYIGLRTIGGLNKLGDVCTLPHHIYIPFDAINIVYSNNGVGLLPH